MSCVFSVSSLYFLFCFGESGGDYLGFVVMELQGVVGLQQGGHTNKSVSFGTGRRCVQLERGISRFVVRCGEEVGKKEGVVLKKGSAVVVTQAPPLLKTAEPMPMMRPNNGVINVGDAGRIMDRRPKDTWAIRFAVGAYLIDRKYFEPLEL